MSQPTDPRTPRRRFGRLRGCLLLCLGLPLLCALALVLIYLRNNRPPEITIPTPNAPPNNAYDDFVRAGIMAKAMKHKSYADSPSPATYTFADYAACAKEARPILDVVRAALSKPCLHPPVRSFDTDYKSLHYPELRELARVLQGVGGYYRRAGKPRQAADTLLDGIEMGVMLGRGAPSDCEEIPQTVQSICLSAFEPILSGLSAADLEHVADRLERIMAKRTPLADGFVHEVDKSIAQETLDLRKHHSIEEQVDDARLAVQLMRSDRDPNAIFALANDPSLSAREWMLVAGHILASKPKMIRDNAAYYRAVAAEAVGPYLGPSRVLRPSNLMAPLILQIDGFRVKAVACDAVLAILQTEVALIRYQAVNGRYPENLAGLAPRYLKNALYDPFGGGPSTPFHYRLLDGGRRYELYSLGPDLKDNGGVSQRYPWDAGPGDIVAGKVFTLKSPNHP